MMDDGEGVRENDIPAREEEGSWLCYEEPQAHETRRQLDRPVKLTPRAVTVERGEREVNVNERTRNYACGKGDDERSCEGCPSARR